MGMARKKRRRIAPAKALSPEQIYQQALQQLAQKNYRQAIDQLKPLAASGWDGPWSQSLCQAYEGRAKELVHKGMYREAVVVWSMAQRLGPVSIPPYLVCLWILAGGQLPKAFAFANEHQEAIQTHNPSDWQQLQTLFAAHLLAGSPELEQAVASTPPWQAQLALAREALAQVCQSNRGQADTLLKSLSVRGPFREWRLLMQGMLVLTTQPDKVSVLLAKIPKNSPFHTMAQTILAAAGPDDALLDILEPLPISYQMLAGELRGMDNAALTSWQHVANQNNPGQTFRMLLKQVDRLPRDDVAALAQAYLPQLPASAIRQYERIFGSLPPWQVHQLRLFRAQIQLEPFEVTTDACHDMLHALEQEPQTPDNLFRRALLLRHVANLLEAEHDQDEPGYLAYLSRSLDLAPAHQPTYLKILAQLSKDKNTLYHQWVNKALQALPEDPAILAIGVDAALIKSTFKKASRLAQKLLALDALDPALRNKIVLAQLQHARKKMRENRWDLARKEITETHPWASTDEHRGMIQINEGLLVLLEGNENQGKTLVTQGCRQISPIPIMQHIQLALAAKSLRLPHPLFEEWERACLNHLHQESPDKNALMALLTHISIWAAAPEQKTILAGWIREIGDYCTHGAECSFSLNERHRFCLILNRMRAFRALFAWAAQGLERFPEDPALTFHHICARCLGDVLEITEHDSDRIHIALEQAEEQENHATIQMIVSWMNYEGLPEPLFQRNTRRAIKHRSMFPPGRGQRRAKEQGLMLLRMLLLTGLSDEFGSIDSPQERQEAKAFLNRIIRKKLPSELADMIDVPHFIEETLDEFGNTENPFL
jgi:hypothetical protein